MLQQLDDRDHHRHSFHFHKKCVTVLMPQRGTEPQSLAIWASIITTRPPIRFSSIQNVDIDKKRKMETQGRRHQKSKTGTNSPQKRRMSPENFKT